MSWTMELQKSKRVRLPEKDVKPILEIRGNLIRYKCGKAYSPPPAKQAGQRCQHFSSQARMRMIRYTSTLDFERIKKSLFVTLTMPDALWPRLFEKRAEDRNQWWKAMEEYVGHQFPALWRTEWEPRKTGLYKGKALPHIHMLLIGVSYIPMTVVNTEWKRALRWTGYCRTEVKRADAEEGALAYITKYCAKPVHHSLVIVPNLDSPDGGHWGVHRRGLVPRCPQHAIEGPPQGAIDWLMALYNTVMHGDGARPGESFTILGKYAKDAMEGLRELGVDVGRCGL